MQSFSEYVSDNLTPVDGESRYADFLNDCYSFADVGGPFAYMRPGDVLREMDPTAFRCGVNDYLDGDDFTYFEGEYYDSREFDQAKEEYESELDAEIARIDEELEELNALRDEEEEGSQLWDAHTANISDLIEELNTTNALRAEFAKV